MNDKILFEACVDSVVSAIAAEQGGAGRLELCAALSEGGITPSIGMIELVKQNVNIPVNVLIRPRAGDFCYTEAEFDIMKFDIERCRQAGISGVVIGILKPDGNIDKERTGRLIEFARPMKVTFHRAFDMAYDPYTALETLIELKAERILTSGQEATALEGLDLLRSLIQKANGRIIIMPGSGINENNIGKILSVSGAKEFHATARESYEGPMLFRNTRCLMGGTDKPGEFTLTSASVQKIKNLINAAAVCQ